MLKIRSSSIHIRLGAAGMTAARDGFLKAWRTREYQGEYLGFESPAGLFSTITLKRWELLARLQESRPMSIRTLSRMLGVDYRRICDDVTALIQIGLTEETDAGRAVWVPFKEIRAGFGLRTRVSPYHVVRHARRG